MRQRTDTGGHPVIDEALLSPRRIWHGVRRWFYFVIVEEGATKYSLWWYVRWERRPYARYCYKRRTKDTHEH